MLKPSDIFECQMCGKCCQGYGGTYVSEKDIETIARRIGVSPEIFVKQYCQMSGGRPVLAQKADGYCVFFDKKCTIHEIKPRMCRQWPFIRAVLVDATNWRIMADSCPGIRLDAPTERVRQVIQAVLDGKV